jgi:DNA-binding transcriptional regulator of glucitol operon
MEWRPRSSRSGGSNIATRVRDSRADLALGPGAPAPDGPRQPATVLLTPHWLALHLLVWVGAVAMVLLGRWQLQVSDDKHFNLQNFGYALQWWTFTAFTLFFWLRAMRDARRPLGQTRGGSRLFVRPGPAADDGVVAVPGRQPAAYVGLADLVVLPDDVGAEPLRYHGYLMPNSQTTPARSEGDGYHASYNDYLWELGQADAARGAMPPPASSAAPSLAEGAVPVVLPAVEGDPSA